MEVSVWSVCTGENPKNCQGSWMAGNDAVHAVMGSNRPRRRDLTCRRVDRTHPRVVHAGPSRSDGPAETPPVVQIPGFGRKASIAFFPRRCGTRDDAVLGRCDAHLNALASATLGLLLLVLLGDLGSLTADLLNEWDGTERRRVSPCCAAHSRTGRERSGRRSTRDATRDAWVGEATRTLPARASEP